MVKAVWNGVTLAQSDDTVIIEGNHYFPPQSIAKDVLVPSETQTICPWKGIANYYSVMVGGLINQDAAWSYRAPKATAENIRDRIAFWKGVNVS